MVASDKREFLEQTLGVPFTEGNAVRVLNNGDEIFPAMLDAIASSQHTIEFLTFVYWKGNIAEKFADALARKARDGVTVRVLLDSFGCSSIENRLIDQMEEAGVQVVWFRRVRKTLFKFDYRTHRKILVCDSRIGFTGGVGIAEEWEGDARNPDEWREVHFEIKGPAVRGLSGAFWDNWIEEDALPEPPFIPMDDEAKGEHLLQALPSSSGYHANDSYKSLYALMLLAKGQLDICTPYFVPSEQLREIVCEKARAGVAVRILIPGAYTDRRFERIEATRYFDQLLDAGVAIYLYQKTMIHNKLILVDDDLALFGSLNFNRRSMSKDEEIGVIALSETLTSQLRSDYETDLQDAKRIDASQWKGPSSCEVLMHKLVAPFRSQM